jgi:hypothetical protein
MMMTDSPVRIPLVMEYAGFGFLMAPLAGVVPGPPAGASLH